MASSGDRAVAPLLAGVEQLDEIGRGGYSVVYRGWEAAHERWVALKVLHEGIGNIGREARALGSLSEHPHVVALFGSGEIDGRPYLLMAYLSGGSLEDRINRGPVAPQEAVATIAAVSSAVEEAHNRGILHRDIKPANILFTSYGVAQLADFGIARFADSTLTEAGLLAATVAYTAPEVLSGGRASPLSDVYSLGATLDAALRGGPAFASRNGEPALALAVRVVGEQPTPLTAVGVPADLATLVSRCMAKDPTCRPQSAAELRAALAVWAASALPRPAEVLIPPGRGRLADPSAATLAPKAPAHPRSRLPAAPVAALPRDPAAVLEQQGPPVVAPPSMRRRRGLLAGAAAAIVVAASVAVGLVASGSGRPTSARQRTATGPTITATTAPTTTATTAPTTTATTAPPTTATTGSGTEASPAGASPAGASPAAASPAAASPAAASPADVAASPSGGPPVAGDVTNPAAEAPSVIDSAVTNYYGLVSRHDLDQSWTWLSPAFQARIGRSYYDQFWTSYAAVQVESVTAVGDDAHVTLRYTTLRGASTTEQAILRYVIESGHLLIDTDQVVG